MLLAGTLRVLRHERLAVTYILPGPRHNRHLPHTFSGSTIASPTPYPMTSHTSSPSPLPSTLSRSKIPFFFGSFLCFVPVVSFDVHRRQRALQLCGIVHDVGKGQATRRKIMSSPNPAQQKRLGRSVPSLTKRFGYSIGTTSLSRAPSPRFRLPLYYNNS